VKAGTISDCEFRISNCGFRTDAVIHFVTPIRNPKSAIRNFSAFILLYNGTLIVFMISSRTASASSLRRIAEE
jgi:hypothetical protein